MIEFVSFSSNTAIQYDKEAVISILDVKFTSTESLDEQQLYNKLNEQLNLLESSLEIRVNELTNIQTATDRFRAAFEEKEDIEQRVIWLQRLYEIKEIVESHSVYTKEAAERLRTRIAPVKLSPMKNELISKIDLLIDSLPPKRVDQIQLSPQEILMEQSLLEAGEEFTNLGKDGREYVIKQFLDHYGDKATVKEVREQAISIEQDINNLLSIREPKELVERLEALPLLSFFHTLSYERKTKIAKKLLGINNWNGLASLNRLISLLDKSFTIEERKQEETKNTIFTSDGKAALTLDIKHVKDGRVQLS